MNAASEARAQVRLALSELYLDRPLPELLRGVLPELAAAPFTLDELRTILVDEVHPAVWTNLLASAGVWEGFDPAWLQARIARNLARPRWRRARGLLLRGHALALWRVMERRIVKLRAQAVSNGGNTQALH